MKFSNLKLGVRLGLGFGAVLMLLIIIATVAITRINQNNEAVDRILNDRYVKVTLVHSMQTEVNNQARALRNAIIGAEIKAEVSSALDLIAVSKTNNDAFNKKLKSMINTPKGEELFNHMADARAKYSATRSETIRLLQAENAAAAGAYLIKVVKPLQDDFFTALAVMVDYQQSRMTSDGVLVQAEGKSAIVITLALGVCAAEENETDAKNFDLSDRVRINDLDLGKG